MELPDQEVCFRALQSRDARFDGLIFVGITSTGIYCRPVCPARTAKRENCRFFGSAAAAQEAGFRPCLRCRPETAPDMASWRGTSNTVSRALALINDGALDGEDANVEKLAERLGLGERQLRRLFMKHLGASPVSVAQTRRVLFAKQLIHETQMSMTDVAMAAGFGSVRRFNEIFRELFDRPPGALRRKASFNIDTDAGTTLRLRYRPPYDWDSMLGYLQARAIPGVEVVENGRYWRAVEIDGFTGSIEVGHLPRQQSLGVTIRFPHVQSLPAIVSRVRRVFDLGADIETIDSHLSRDPLLAPLVARRPGLRAPGGWDGFELAVRAILGQQISVIAARRLAGELVVLHGKALAKGKAGHSALTHVFPTASRLASAKSVGLGMPAARQRSLKALAEATVDDPNLFRPFGTIEEAIVRLRMILGVGEWTAHYIALRALREMDAFPASDIGLLRSAALMDGTRSTAATLLDRAESWRPWRAYAAQHLWAADANVILTKGIAHE
ncbi:MAG TPA: AlkA N-terminal domain-containing protein [Edaphobacter sp.]|jgi:AraC family transcriptional regulator of adaptative response / DNA-3-methyladenine glycosylase II|nr:AlkA N-terminal domain-containing protein [Edaphobacter sp.]